MNKPQINSQLNIPSDGLIDSIEGKSDELKSDSTNDYAASSSESLVDTEKNNQKASTDKLQPISTDENVPVAQTPPAHSWEGEENIKPDTSLEREIKTADDQAEQDSDDTKSQDISDRPSIAIKTKKQEQKRSKTKNQKKNCTNRKPINRTIIKKILKWLFRFVVLVIIALLCFCIWNRWFRFDDHKDIQGTWKIDNSNSAVVISDSTIALHKNAILNYTLDTGSKMIYFSIGEMKGQSHYRFSNDRKWLAICENSGDNIISTAISDTGWFFSYLDNSLEGQVLTPAYTIWGNADSADKAQVPIEDVIKEGIEDNILLIRM